MGKIFRTVVIVCGLAVVLAACGRRPEKLVAEPESETSSTEKVGHADLARELSDIKYSQSKNGKVEWELQATGVQQALDGPTVLQQVKITYYSTDGRITVVTADSGTYDTKTKDAQLQGNVVVTTSDGATLATDSIKWDQGAGLLTGPGDVKITRSDSIIEGKGFQLSPEAETATLFQVKGVIRRGEMKL